MRLQASVTPSSIERAARSRRKLMHHVIISAWACGVGYFGKVAASTVQPASPRIQLVESVPEATIYGQPSVPRTGDVWLDMIAHAQRNIDITAFYLSDDAKQPLHPILEAIASKARSGVKVRLLVDQDFLKESQATLDWLKTVPGIEIQVLPMRTLTGGVLHAKYVVVDNQRTFIGSQNWDWRALNQIHEIGIRIDDQRFAQTVDAIFVFNWNLAIHPDTPQAQMHALDTPDFVPVTASDPIVLAKQSGETLTAFPAFSPPMLIPHWATPEEPALIQMIEHSQHVLRIQVMTLSAIKQYGPKGWWAPLDTAIRDAAARGVKVRIIVADWALREPMQAYLKSLAALPNITIKFGQLPPSPQGFIPFARVEHAKYAVADQRDAFIGTGNWEWSYFNNTVDASVFVQGTQPAAQLISIFDRDWNGPYVTTLNISKTYASPRTH